MVFRDLFQEIALIRTAGNSPDRGSRYAFAALMIYVFGAILTQRFLAAREFS
jgi:hypothetical protein